MSQKQPVLLDKKFKEFKVFKERTEYKNLSESSKKRLASELVNIYKSGYRISELERMDDKNLKIALNTKQKDMNAKRKLLRQIKGSEARRKGTIQEVINDYKKEGYRLKRIKQIRIELSQISGNIFSDIRDKVLITDYAYIKDLDIATRKANERTEYLLSIPKKMRNKIDDIEQYERDLLNMYSP